MWIHPTMSFDAWFRPVALTTGVLHNKGRQFYQSLAAIGDKKRVAFIKEYTVVGWVPGFSSISIIS
jgi:hypothetical protein